MTLTKDQPKRLIREDLLTSERVAAISLQAQLFYQCLMLIADDFGLYEASPRILRSKCFPLRDEVTVDMVASWLIECSKELLLSYEIDGKKYLQILNFNQRLRTKSARYPMPQNAAERSGLRLEGKGREEKEGGIEADEVETRAQTIIDRHPNPQKMPIDAVVREIVSQTQPHETALKVAREMETNHRALCLLPNSEGGWMGREPKFIPTLRKWMPNARDPTAPTQRLMHEEPLIKRADLR